MMDTSRLVKLIVVIAVIFVLWKYGLPWIKAHTGSSTAQTITADNSCVAAAERANDAWGSGIGRFANPPYDLEAWGTFKDGVLANISTAETACNGAEASCAKARDAMRDLRSLAGELDASIRSGAPPGSEIVQKQEGINTQLETARALVQGGK